MNILNKAKTITFSLMTLVFGVSGLQAEPIYKPKADIANWAQGARADAKLLARHSNLRAEQERMPIYCRLAFNKYADSSFLEEFFKFLKSFDSLKNIRPGKHRKFKDQFIFSVDHSVKREEIESILNQADHYFNDEIRRLEQLEIEKRNKELADREVKCKELERLAAIERKEIERLAVIKREEIKLEQEKLAKVRAEQERLRVLAEEAKEKQLLEGLCRTYSRDNYLVSVLPLDFHIDEPANCCLNKNGQIAGYIKIKETLRAVLLDPNKNLKLFPLDGPKSISTAVNDNGWVAVKVGQTHTITILWNANTNELRRGLSGNPLAISNNEVVLIQQYKKYILWDSKNNVITEINGSNSLVGLDDVGAPCSDLSHNRIYFISPSCSRYVSLRPGDSVLRPDSSWIYDGKIHFLPELSGIRPSAVRLNDAKNEVVAACGNLLKWRKHCKDPEILLKGIGHVDIFGFSNSGKILLGDRNSLGSLNLRLLTPIK